MVIDVRTWGDMEGLDQLLDALWHHPTFRQRHLAFPPVNVEETEDALIVSAAIPGVSPEEVAVTLEEKSLIVRGERRGEAGRYFRQERPVGAFLRVVALEYPVEPAGVHATLRHGILTVTLPKAQSSAFRRIPVEDA